MFKSNFKVANIIVLIFVPIWRSFVFIGISVFSFLTLAMLSTLDVVTAVVIAIIFVPFMLAILFILYSAAMAISKEIDKINNKVLEFISNKVIPPIVFFLIGRFSSAVEEKDKFMYYLSIPLSMLISYFFDKIIKFLERPKNQEKIV